MLGEIENWGEREMRIKGKEEGRVRGSERSRESKMQSHTDTNTQHTVL